MFTVYVQLGDEKAREVDGERLTLLNAHGKFRRSGRVTLKFILA